MKSLQMRSPATHPTRRPVATGRVSRMTRTSLRGLPVTLAIIVGPSNDLLNVPMAWPRPSCIGNASQMATKLDI
jgi:hypothetical protein